MASTPMRFIIIWREWYWCKHYSLDQKDFNFLWNGEQAEAAGQLKMSYCYKNRRLLREQKQSKDPRTKYLRITPRLQYFGHLMQRVDSFEKTLMLGKIESRRRRGWDDWMASLIQWTWVWANSGRLWRTGRPGVLQSIGHKESDRLGNWTTTQAAELEPN